MNQLERSWVDPWALRYDTCSKREVEDELFEVTGPSIASAGYLTLDQLLKVGEWKSRRALGHLGRNEDGDVRDLTGIALGAPRAWRHSILTLLSGVGYPMASAILTVWRPAEYTVSDVYGRGALHRVLGHPETGPYLDYVDACAREAHRLGVDLRTLDKAFWQWGSEGFPPDHPQRPSC